MSRAVPSFGEVIRRRHLPALDGLRAIAVFAVILGHANYPVRGVPADLGVSAFFVLSGFLITRLLVREYDATGAISLRSFYVRRTMRIFPAYYAFLAFSLLLDARQGQRWDPALLGSALTYTVNYFNAFHHHPSTSVAHAWSLAVEEQFYLLWPFVFVLFASRGRRALIGAVGAMAVGAVAWRSWLALVSHADVSYLYNAFDTRFDNLAIGCLVALVVGRPSVIRLAERLGTHAWQPLVTVALLMASRLTTGEAYHYSIGFTVDAVLVAILIIQLLRLQATALWSWLEHPVTRFLGTISYPIYLYHAWGASIGRHLAPHGTALEFAAALAATLMLACGSYYVVERPFLRLKRRFEVDTSGVRRPPVNGPTAGVLASNSPPPIAASASR